MEQSVTGLAESACVGGFPGDTSALVFASAQGDNVGWVRGTVENHRTSLQP